MKEAVISDAMNDDDDTSNINSCNDFDNNRIGDGDDKCNHHQISQVWGTWEELVLTCAVKRHGFSDWDSIAKEVQVRCRSSLIATAANCKLKYQDLKRRFQDSVDGGDGNNEAAGAAEDTVGEITWLEQLRSLHVAELRRDIDRRNESILSLQLKVKRLQEEKDGDDVDKKPDLRNGETKPARLNRETTESDRDDNRSMNESGTSTGPAKRKEHKYRSGGGNGDLKLTGDKSQPLINIIELIRSHPHGSVFDSRLRSQETNNYKSLIRQHMDIKTIEKKMKKGSYVSSNLSFYRDLKLIFTNAIVFFPTSSSESMAAQELRTLVSNEMKKRTGNSSQSVIKTEDESSGSKQKSSVLPLVVCKKKSSASKKSSPSSSFKQKDEKKSPKVSEEKTVTAVNTTTARSSRRTSKEVAKDTKPGKAKNTKTESSNDDDKEETSKTEKKTGAVTSKKKKSVVDFLKRIKKNSPEKGKENQKKSDGSVEKEESNVKTRELRSNNKSSSKQKQTKETVKATGKRSKESGKDDKQPKKRSRR